MRRFLGANNQTANLLAAVGCNCVPIVDVRVFVQKQIDEASPVGRLKRQATVRASAGVKSIVDVDADGGRFTGIVAGHGHAAATID